MVRKWNSMEIPSNLGPSFAFHLFRGVYKGQRQLRSPMSVIVCACQWSGLKLWAPHVEAYKLR